MTKSNVKKTPATTPPSNGSKTHGRIADIAARTGMAPWAVEEAIRSGELPSIPPGKHNKAHIVSFADADAWIAKLEQPQRDERREQLSEERCKELQPLVDELTAAETKGDTEEINRVKAKLYASGVEVADEAFIRRLMGKS